MFLLQHADPTISQSVWRWRLPITTEYLFLYRIHNIKKNIYYTMHSKFGHLPTSAQMLYIVLDSV